MARRRIVPERIWVGSGVLIFALVLLRKGLGDGSALIQICAAVFGLCGAMILAGLIRPPHEGDGEHKSKTDEP